jgi:hypothetical protein
MPRTPEKFRTLYLDPGEDFGWCVGRDTKLLAAGTEKMWQTADEIWFAMNNPDDPSGMFNDPDYARSNVTADEMLGEIGRVVCEDFRIYPWKAKALGYDQVRTARVIGAVTFMCRQLQIPFVLQGANIKKTAKLAGAEELYYRPVEENRHQNDAIQHFVFFTNVELMQVPLPIPAGYDETEDYH